MQVLFCVAQINREEVAIRNQRESKKRELGLEHKLEQLNDTVRNLTWLFQNQNREKTEAASKLEVIELSVHTGREKIDRELRHLKHKQQQEKTSLLNLFEREQKQWQNIQGELTNLQRRPDVSEHLHNLQERLEGHEERQNDIIDNLTAVIASQEVATEKRLQLEDRVGRLEHSRLGPGTWPLVETSTPRTRGGNTKPGKAVEPPGGEVTFSQYDGGYRDSDSTADEDDVDYHGGFA